MPGARDGQVRIRRGTDSPPWGLDLYDDTAGLWRDVAYAAGVPVLRGPYAVDYTDIPHDGNTKTLWTPQVGDVVLRVFCDWQGATQWNSGRLQLGIGNPMSNCALALADNGFVSRLDTCYASATGNMSNFAGGEIDNAAYVCHSTDPIALAWQAVGDPDSTQGHVALFALIARPVAP